MDNMPENVDAVYPSSRVTLFSASKMNGAMHNSAVSRIMQNKVKF